MFFNELNKALSKAVNSHENIIVVRDLNIDTRDRDKDRNNYLSNGHTFFLSNLINRKIFHKNLSGETIAITQPNCFHKTSTSCLKTTFENIPPKKYIYFQLFQRL